MRILDKKNVEFKSPNMKKGKLREDKIFVKHHKAIEAVAEQGHWETIAEYPSGGKDVRWHVDVPAVEAKEAWDEYEDVLRYEEYTEEELDVMRKAPLTLNEKLMMLAESIEEEPYPSHPPKSGHIYQRMYSATKNKIVWTLVPDPDESTER